MKKRFGLYFICWLAALGIFHIACFVSPAEMNGYTKIDAAFWTGYLFITVAFLAQLGCAYKAFCAESKDKFFLKIPLISVSYSALILILIAGVLCMAIPDLPIWIGILICCAVSVFSAIAIVKAYAAGEIVSDMDDKVQAQSFFIRSLTADAETLLAKASTEESKVVLKKVYEAVRYSDPISNAALASMESQITIAFSKLADAVAENNAEIIETQAAQLLILVNDRNKKCKLLK